MHYTLCDLAADLAQNAAEAGASLVEAEFAETDEEFRFQISDNGKGMDEKTRSLALDPFYTDGVKHPGRRIGLGLPFLIQTAEQCGGRWSLESKPGLGTKVEAVFPLNSVDLPPLGALPVLFRDILTYPGPAEVKIVRTREKKGGMNRYVLIKSELTDILGGFDEVSSLVLLTEYLRSQELDD